MPVFLDVSVAAAVVLLVLWSLTLYWGISKIMAYVLGMMS